MTQAAAHPFRWAMLFGASLIYACFGALMAAMSVLVKPISDDLELGPLQMGTVLGAWQFVYLFLAVPTGAVLDRVGIRPCLLIASLILTASAALRVVVDSYAGLLLAVLLFGVGGPLISVGAPKLVSRWFAGPERGLAMGIYMSSTGIGALLATIGTNSVIMPFVGGDWQAAFRVYTLIMLCSVVVWLWIAAMPGSRQAGMQATSPAQLSLGVIRQLLSSREVQVTMMMAVTMFFFVHAMHAWLPEILRAKGLSLVEASYWAGVPAIIAIVAALVVTRLAIPRRRTTIMALVASVAIGSALFLEVQPLALLLFCLVGLGIARSALVPIAMLALMESKSPAADSMGSASGLFFTAGQIGGVLAPVLCGLAIDLTGSYDAPLWLMALVMLILLTLIPRLRQPPPAHPGSGRGSARPAIRT